MANNIEKKEKCDYETYEMKKSAFVARDVVHAMTNCDAEIIDRQFYDDTSENNLILQHF